MYLNKWDFNPRAGFAYKLSAGARPIVVRGGYGDLWIPDAATGIQRAHAVEPAHHGPIHLPVVQLGADAGQAAQLRPAFGSVHPGSPD